MIEWEAQFVLAQLLVNRDVLTCERVTCALHDSSMSGRPIEGTTYMKLWDAAMNRCGYMPLQVGLDRRRGLVVTQ